MKGRNCYACFLVTSGTKKSFTITPKTKGFFVPVTQRLSQREPFSRVSAAGKDTDSQPHVSSAMPAAVFLLLLIFGCSQTPSAILQPPGTWSGFTVEPDIPIDVRTKIGPMKRANILMIRSLYYRNSYFIPNIFHMSVVPACMCCARKYACGPTVLRGYRDIDK